MLQLLDDFLFYSKDEKSLLDDFKAYLSVCNEIELNLHAKKTKVFAEDIQFCGRIISSDGIKYHPRHFDTLLNMKKPTLASDL